MKNSQKIKSFVKYGFIAALALVAANNPSFAAIDVSGATDSISTDGTAAVTAVGTAIIGLAGVAVVFKWVKGAIFG